MSLSPDSKTRPVGATEHGWCKAVPGGTGVTVLVLLFSKAPDIQFLQNALRKLQLSHPILNSKLHFDPPSDTFYYTTPPSPHIQIQTFDLQSTSQILRSKNSPNDHPSISPLHLILEHELNNNDLWRDPDPSSDSDLFFASCYTLDDNKWVVALRLHTSVCDRTSAVALLKELLGMMEEREVNLATEKEMEVSMGIEEFVPSGQGSKPFWARGVDMLGYSFNSLRLATLEFKDTVSPRMSRVARFQMTGEETGRVLSLCNMKGIKLCALVAAAALIASHSLKDIPNDQCEKYAVVTLIDCRPILQPVLSTHHFGFYHSAILNTHDVQGGESLWDLARRVYSPFKNAKDKKKHFSDMSDLNVLMCKAIENPGLTPSASLRTSLISVFEDSTIDVNNDDLDKVSRTIGLEDFMGCSSAHGVGPSVAIFDMIRNGRLDCACVFPYPLHSREQMRELMGEMKRIILQGTF